MDSEKRFAKLEARLRQREEQLKLTIQHAPTGIGTVDLNGRLLTVNAAFCSMVGYSEEELAGRPVNSITHPDDVEMAERRLLRLRNGEVEQYRVRKRYIRKDGGLVEGMMTAAVVHDSEGNPFLYVAHVEDLTERLKAETEINQSRERLAHVTRIQMIGEMVAGIAHEINQPLTAIATYAQASGRMIRAGMADSEELLAALDKISRQAQRAGDVIRHLRKLVRERPSAEEAVDLNALIAEVVPLAEVDARMHDSTIQLDLAAGLPPILADPIQIQQVVLNLVRNGMEAMGANDPDEKAVILGCHLGEDDTLEITVRDQGSGIPKGTDEELFQTFFTTKSSGMGMGLAISRSIVESHGGRLWFTRNPDRGSTFHVSLPLAGGGDHETS